MKGKWKQIFSVRYGDRPCGAQRDRGSVLPMVMGLGTIMMLAGAVLILQSQQGQSLAKGRTINGNSIAIAEGGVARTLALLTKPENAVLLSRNYDTINPNTGTTYLGSDGVLGTGDEENGAVDGWRNINLNPPGCTLTNTTPTPNISYTGTISRNGQYTLLAYRYNPQEQTATLLVEGKEENFPPAHIVVKISIASSYLNFPGVSVSHLNLAGRKVLGKNGNIYYNSLLSLNPFLRGFAPPGSHHRGSYLFAIWSGGDDNISGTIYACHLPTSLRYTPPTNATNLGWLNASRNISNTTGSIDSYIANKIDLNGSSALIIDTTQGPVYIYVTGDVTLKGNAQIKNVRSDGKPPRVGDLRLIVGPSDFDDLTLYDRACIDTAFIYNPNSDLYLWTSGDGCPSNGESNIDGVVWTGSMSQAHTGSVSGIAVPDDVSSLSDILGTVNLPIQAKDQISGVKSWQRVKL